MSETIRDCPDCAVKPGEPHWENCDVQRCSACGDQRLVCECEDHDPLFARWTGIWPGVAEAIALGHVFQEDTPWPNGMGSWPAGTVDLNRFYADDNLCRIFFIKPDPEAGST